MHFNADTLSSHAQVDLGVLNREERIAFCLNLYNVWLHSPASSCFLIYYIFFTEVLSFLLLSNLCSSVVLHCGALLCCGVVCCWCAHNTTQALVIHGLTVLGSPNALTRTAFFRDTAYWVGPYPFSLDDLEHGLLRANALHPTTKTQFFPNGDPRAKWVRRARFALCCVVLCCVVLCCVVLLIASVTLTRTSTHVHVQALAASEVDPRIHFALVCGAKSCPPVRLYKLSNLERGLKLAATGFCDREIEIDTAKKTVGPSPPSLLRFSFLSRL